jgi:hypothetical protein
MLRPQIKTLLGVLALAATVRAAGEDTAAPPDTSKTPPKSETDDVFSDLESQLSAPPGSPEAQSNTARAAPEPTPTATGSPVAGSRGVMNPDLSVIADFAAAAFSDENHLQSGGHDPTRTGFNLQSFELSASAPVDPYLRFDSHVVFLEDGVEVEEAYGTTLDLPGGVQARFGQFLTRFGRLNATHPHSWDFVDQPFAIGRVFGGDGNRGLGGELSWLLPLPWYVELVGSTVHPANEDTARSFVGDAPRTVRSPKDLIYVGALKQSFDLDDDWTLLWGLSGAFGPGNQDDTRTEVYGSDVYLKFRPITRGSYFQLTWQSEVLYRRRHLAETLGDVNGYTQLFARVARRWGTAARYEYGSPAYANGHATADPLDPEWTDSRYRIAANVTHWPSEFSRFRLQGSMDLPGWRPKPIYAVFLAAELVVGAHGAHQF